MAVDKRPCDAGDFKFSTADGSEWRCRLPSGHLGPHEYREVPYGEADPEPRIVCLDCVEIVSIHTWVPVRWDYGNPRKAEDYLIAYECKCGRGIGTVSRYSIGKEKKLTIDQVVSRKDFESKHFDVCIQRQRERIQREFQRLTTMEWAAGIDHSKDIADAVCVTPEEKWSEVIEQLESRRKISLRGYYEFARVLKWTPSELELGFAPDDDSRWAGENAAEAANIQELEDVLNALGYSVRVSVRMLEPQAPF